MTQYVILKTRFARALGARGVGAIRLSRRWTTTSLMSASPPPSESASAESLAEESVEPRIRWEAIGRIVNVVIASLALILVSPLIVLAAVLVKLTSPGPIFYTQPRVGLDRRRPSTGSNAYDRRAHDLGGRPFMIYKFRTMSMGAEKTQGAVWATKRDARVTAVGRVLRTYRIDELPQLVNVIRGEMNIVGPRPERPSIFLRLSGDVAGYRLRQRAMPGITGWAQVNQSYDTNLDDVRAKVRFDLEYLRRQGVAEDLAIMARTLPVLIFRKGGW